jgi:PIN domain nuclease of toxin-antitoxin system
VKILPDTHIFLWAALAPERLTMETQTILDSPDNIVLFSVISIWEIAIKSALNRADFPVDPIRLRNNLLKNGYSELSVTSDHALTAAALPLLHRDPFDRMLVAQAITEDCLFLTRDPIIAQYGEPVRLV